jgi:hypothetical protein
MIVPDKLAWLFELVPMWFRTRWPLKRFYWQQEEIEEAKEKAKEVGHALGFVPYMDKPQMLCPVSRAKQIEARETRDEPSH